MIESIIALVIFAFGILFYFKKGDTSMHDYVKDQFSSIYNSYRTVGP